VASRCVCGIGSLGLLIMQHKDAIAAAQATSHVNLRRCRAHSKIPVPGVAGRIDHFTAFPTPAPEFCRPGHNSMECKYLQAQKSFRVSRD